MNIIRQFAKFLKDRRGHLVRDIEVNGIYYDPTYGNQSTIENISVIDFDALLKAMDEFSAEFEGE